MPETEGLGKTGWGVLAAVVVAIVVVATFGLSAAIYLGLLGTAAAMAILIVLCLGDRRVR
jgi:hypothetical protein